MDSLEKEELMETETVVDEPSTSRALVLVTPQQQALVPAFEQVHGENPDPINDYGTESVAVDGSRPGGVFAANHSTILQVSGLSFDGTPKILMNFPRQRPNAEVDDDVSDACPRQGCPGSMDKFQVSHEKLVKVCDTCKNVIEEVVNNGPEFYVQDDVLRSYPFNVNMSQAEEVFSMYASKLKDHQDEDQDQD